jgi:cobalamin biosynthesis protein CobD/CbiB
MELAVCLSRAYKAVNTLDSMVGIKMKNRDFGFASAKLDDLLNYVSCKDIWSVLLVQFFHE